MPGFLVVIHVIVCIALILIVLLQTGKGADMGAAFGGGGSNTLFGATGASTFLGKLTTAAAVVFMLTSLILAYMSTNRTSSSILQNRPAVQQPVAPANGTKPETKATEQKPAAAPQTGSATETPQKTE